MDLFRSSDNSKHIETAQTPKYVIPLENRINDSFTSNVTAETATNHGIPLENPNDSFASDITAGIATNRTFIV
ncbi:hypothetical protein BABINDRAFT_160144 [Babjeviella inositovora NRRL Y-12698]|uniref:Uncharacterized protein n=1 Tax=Babjeviella inositovora NRRL Y-12698 TaxID=984486 RepID=A0A1E3QXY2_9ASCO|nr:uncharacterized protein BABINDRAFT_160144 [Babjeviella inositovora NRRL Y-12698]ODQ81917.1 hypothetical protein BABINDRAFT_160144 [Babjeviella inositovora NRRL Y-12698]